MQRLVLYIAVCLITIVSVSQASAADWGDLKVKFVYGGDAPTPSPINVTKDVEYCKKHGLVDEALVVNKKNRGIQNIIGYIYQSRTGVKKLPVHPDLAKATPAKALRLDNKNCRFEPHVIFVRTGQQLILGNKDDVGHNMKFDTFANDPINQIIPSGGELPHVFETPEKRPAKVSCSIHPWMMAWVVVKDDPYVGITNKDGALEIKNLPTGTWTFQFWQEKAGYVREVVRDGKATTWSKGRLELEIKKGVNDLGMVEVLPSLFED